MKQGEMGSAGWWLRIAASLVFGYAHTISWGRDMFSFWQLLSVSLYVAGWALLGMSDRRIFGRVG